MPKRVLVIDDEHDIRALVCKFLDKKGFSTVAAKNGWQGMRMALRFTPDIILLDIGMPWINGFAVLKKLKASKKTIAIPVIMLTGRADDESKIKASNLYNECYITKPFDLEELESKIKEILKIKA
ncbi:MAG: response regulator [Candidatus Omnitrophica bacterium]|nr:response regulator [Candidatus Omnitrophota bacterium]